MLSLRQRLERRAGDEPGKEVRIAAWLPRAQRAAADVAFSCRHPTLCRIKGVSLGAGNSFVGGLMLPAWVLGFAGVPFAAAALSVPVVMGAMYYVGKAYGRRKKSR